MVLMNTSLNRLQAWSGLLLSTLLFLCSAVAFLSYPSPSLLSSPVNPAANLTVYNLEAVLGRNRWHPDRRTQEFLEFEFEFRTDLLGDSHPLNAAVKKRGAVWNRWNTKQVFLSLVAEWDSPPRALKGSKGGSKPLRGQSTAQDHDDTDAQSAATAAPIEKRKNQAVLWDRIVRRPEDAQIWTRSKNKYGWREMGGRWSDISSAKFSLRWNVMPHVGLLAYGQEAQTGSIPIPVRIVSDSSAGEVARKMPY